MRLFAFGKRMLPEKHTTSATLEPEAPIDKKKVFSLSEANNSRFTLCTCCNPIPGDAILGYVDERNHVHVHKAQCDVAQRLKANKGNLIVAAQWDMGNVKQFETTLSLRGIDKPGTLNQITHVISSAMNINIRKLEIDCNDGLFESTIRLYVHDTREVKNIVNSLKKLPAVKEVARI
jgi:GTP pyrophosphokinase